MGGKLISIIQVLFALVLLGSCSAQPKIISPDQVQGFIVGQTTEQQVIAKLGDPAYRTTTPGNGIFLSYNYLPPPDPSKTPSFAAPSRLYHESGNQQQGVFMAFRPDGVLVSIQPTYTPRDMAH